MPQRVEYKALYGCSLPTVLRPLDGHKLVGGH